MLTWERIDKQTTKMFGPPGVRGEELISSSIISRNTNTHTAAAKIVPKLSS